jgi:hypothetical protein
MHVFIYLLVLATGIKQSSPIHRVDSFAHTFPDRIAQHAMTPMQPQSFPGDRTKRFVKALETQFINGLIRCHHGSLLVAQKRNGRIHKSLQH